MPSSRQTPATDLNWNNRGRLDAPDLSIGQKRRNVDYGEIGTTGNYFIYGREIYEYQTELQGEKKFEEYDKMRRGSAMARATFQAITLPLMGASWFVRPPGNKRSDKKMADFIYHNLFHSLNISFSKLIFQICLMLIYGVYPFEKVFIRSKKHAPWKWGGDHIVLKKLSPRHPMTILFWNTDDNGELDHITQRGYFNVQNGSVYRSVQIPVNKMLLFRNEQEGDNWEGMSIYRTGYGHWRTIKNYYNIANIGVERMSIGYPVFTYPANFWELHKNDRDECSKMFNEILRNFRAHPHAGAKIPPGATMEIVKGEFNSTTIERLIDHHELKIAQAALATFLKVGESKTGSHALSKDQSDFFLKSLIAIGQDVCDTINMELIPELINLNFKEVDAYPELYVRNIGSRDLKEFAEVIQILVKSFCLTPDEEGTLEDDVRKVYDLPPRTDEQKARIEKMIKEEKSVFVNHPGNQNSYTSEAIAQNNLKNNPNTKMPLNAKDGEASKYVDQDQMANEMVKNKSADDLYNPAVISGSGSGLGGNGKSNGSGNGKLKKVKVGVN